MRDLPGYVTWGFIALLIFAAFIYTDDAEAQSSSLLYTIDNGNGTYDCVYWNPFQGQYTIPNQPHCPEYR